MNTQNDIYIKWNIIQPLKKVDTHCSMNLENLESIMLSERNQTQMDKYCYDFTYIKYLQYTNSQTQKTSYQGLEVKGNEKLLLNGLWLAGMKHPENTGDGCTTTLCM